MKTQQRPASGSHNEPARPRLDDVLSVLRRHQSDLAARYAVRSLGVFGSYVRGEATADSDLDVLVE